MNKENLQEITGLRYEKFDEGIYTCSIPHDKFKDCLEKLFHSLRFEILIDVFGIDYPDEELRFEVVYHLLSIVHNCRVILKLRTGSCVPTISDLFPNASWYEREVFDMYGVVFDKHPDLRRILTDYGFEGYPMRKDFPLTGYKEVKFDIKDKKVVYVPVDLQQDYRSFDTLSPWEGK